MSFLQSTFVDIINQGKQHITLERIRSKEISIISVSKLSQFTIASGLNGGGRAGDTSGYMSDGDLIRSRIQGHHGPPGHSIYGGYTSDTNYGGYTSDNTYNDPGYISDNHYNRYDSST